MYLRMVDDVQPGQILAKTLYTENGEVLVAAGVRLGAEYIAGLRRRGVAACYVRDGLADDVVPAEVIDEAKRAQLVGHVVDVFDAVIARTKSATGTEGDGPPDVDAALDRMAGHDAGLGAGAEVGSLYDDVDQLVDELLAGDFVGPLDSLKSHSAYTFQHSVDVAVVSIAVSRNAGLPREQIRELALGAMLHDLGKIAIEQTILDKPAALTQEERAQIERHPEVGFELVRRMPIFSILPAHVAFQHHERQDGGGYPRGLTGSNRFVRSSAERFDPGRILQIAEIAAVADVYGAITSDRPYRPAMGPDRVVAVMRQMSGAHLNREITETLMRSIPAYPVGWWVEATAGPRRGFRGVVVDVHRDALNRPSVRWLLDARGEALASPDEEDLRADEVTQLRCMPRGEAPTGQRDPAGAAAPDA